MELNRSLKVVMILKLGGQQAVVLILIPNLRCLHYYYAVLKIVIFSTEIYFLLCYLFI